jgi:trehalose 6-phosphate synthase/phosphatase
VSLYPFEFVYAHKLMQDPGVVVVSEFSGSSRVLTGSLGINPWKRNEIVDALVNALTMSAEEKAMRHVHDFEYIEMNTRTKWAERILVDLKRTSKTSSANMGMQYMGYGLGLGYRMFEFNAGFKMLETDALVRAYRHSFNRVLLFDYGNTLQQEALPAHDFSKYIVQNYDHDDDDEDITKDASSSSSSPPLLPKFMMREQLKQHDTPAAAPELLTALTALCADPRNTVFVLSGKDRVDLENTLGSVRGLGLAAEHGYLYRWGIDGKEGMTNSSSNRGGGDMENLNAWLCTKENFDDSWKDITHSVMDIYTQVCYIMHERRKI